MTVTIRPIQPRGRDLRTFIGLPAQIYAGQAGFAPSLRTERDMLLHPRKAGFFKRGRAQYWLALRDGVAVGRISAQIDPHLPRDLPAGTGLFGAIDAIDDAGVVAALFAAAESWLADQGCSYAFGPCLLDINTEPGLLVAGQDEPPMTLTAWHPAYLERHITALGYNGVRDLFAWKLDPRSIDLTHWHSKDMRRRQSAITLRQPNLFTLTADSAILCDLYNEAWADNWGFVPLDKGELAHMIRSLWLFQPAEATKIAELGGKPVAMLMSVPNMFDLSAGLGFDPSPLGWLRLGLRTLRFRPKSVRVILFGLRPHLRNTAAGAVIVKMLIDDIISLQARHKVDYIEAGWVLEHNHALNAVFDRFGFHRSKTFRLFGKTLVSGKAKETVQ